MKKMMSSMLIFGAGMAAYNLAQKNKISTRQMKQWQKKMKRTIF